MTKTNPVRRAIIPGAIAVAVAAITGAGLAGFYFGSSSSWAAESAFENGQRSASTTYCNLQFTEEHESYTFDGRTYQGAATNVVVADAVCTDAQILERNEAQEGANRLQRGQWRRQ